MTGAAGPPGSCDAGLCKDVTYKVEHRGWADATKHLAAIAALFPAPSKVTTGGGSAGAYGVDCNLIQVRGTYPGVKMYELNDAGPPVNPRYAPDFVADTASWGAFHFADDGTPVTDTCPQASPSGVTSWSVMYVNYYNQLHFPDVRKAAAISRFDETIGGFSCAFGATPDAAGSCQWVVADSISDFMRSFLVSRAPDWNYKAFAADSSCHGYTRDSPPECDYTTIVQDGVRFHDWIKAWMEVPSPVAWRNVVDPGRTPIP
jgi:hypothetical protein